MTDHGVGAGVERAGLIDVPEFVEIDDVFFEVFGKGVVDELLVVFHLLADLGGDHDFPSGLLHPHPDEVLIDLRPAGVVGDVFGSGVERVELLRAFVVDTRGRGAVGAQLQGDEFFRLKTVFFHSGEGLFLVEDIDAETAVGTEFHDRGFHARVFERLQGFGLAGVDEGGVAQELDAFRGPLARDHVGEVGLSLKAVGFADLPAVAHEVRRLTHARTAQEKVGPINCLPHRAVFFAERPLYDFETGKTFQQHRVHFIIRVRRPEDDLSLGEIVFEDTQRPRSMPDVADVLHRPGALEEDRFFWPALRESRERSRPECEAGGFEKRAAGGVCSHGRGFRAFFPKPRDKRALHQVGFGWSRAAAKKEGHCVPHKLPLARRRVKGRPKRARRTVPLQAAAKKSSPFIRLAFRVVPLRNFVLR